MPYASCDVTSWCLSWCLLVVHGRAGPSCRAAVMQVGTGRAAVMKVGTVTAPGAQCILCRLRLGLRDHDWGAQSSDSVPHGIPLSHPTFTAVSTTLVHSGALMHALWQQEQAPSQQKNYRHTYIYNA